MIKVEPREGKLSLTNNGDLQVYWLGVGGAFSPTHDNTNFLIIKGDDHLLVDFGITGPSALRRAGLLPHDIKAFLPTHSHADHVGGMETLGLMHRYIGKSRPSVLISKEYQDFLWDNTLKGGMYYNEFPYLSFEHYFKPVRPNGCYFWLGGFSIMTFQTNHVAAPFPSYGLVVDNKFMFSGDSNFNSERIIRLADRVETIFHDASLMPNPSHASVAELRTLPQEIRDKMYLVHYGTSQDTFHDGFAGIALQDHIYTWERQ